MKRILSQIGLTFFLLLLFLKSQSQETRETERLTPATTDSLPAKNSKNATSGNAQVVATITADSLASGNYKDVLSSFYQIALNNLTGPAKELKFTSNPYAIMLKGNPAMQQSYYYHKYRNLRNLNFNVDLKLDSNYKFNGFSTGITYAIINKRDFTISKYFGLQEFNNVNDNNYHKLANLLNQRMVRLPLNNASDTAFYFTVTDQVNKLFRPGFTFDKLDKKVSDWILSIQDSVIETLKQALRFDPALNIDSAQHAGFDSLVANYQTKLLWTANVNDTSYADGGLFKAVQMYTEVLDGIGSSNFEFDGKLSVNFINDSLRTGRNLGRQFWMVEPGINWKLVGKVNQKSYFEFKLGGSVSYFFNGLYKNEDRLQVTLNGTARIRIFDDVWIPLQFAYDPKNGNLFGFINIKTNFTGLGSMFKTSGSK